MKLSLIFLILANVYGPVHGRRRSFGIIPRKIRRTRTANALEFEDDFGGKLIRKPFHRNCACQPKPRTHFKLVESQFINVRSCQSGLFDDDLEVGSLNDQCQPVVELIKTLQFDGIPKQVRFVERCGCPKLAMAQDAVTCDAGMMVGIDMYGNTDESNTDTCFPTLDAANIISCNNPTTNAAEMTIQISADFYSSFGSVAGYTQNEEDGTWTKVVPLTRANMRLSTDQNDAELVYSENSEQVLLNGVYFSVQKSIEFVCQYSLADQSVEADFNIAGKDMEFARAARGQLHYTLVPTTETVIGDDHHFDIIPATPGVIYSRVTQCTVVNQGDTSLTYDLTTVNGDDVCTDPITSFALTSTGGYCTDQTQEFKYQSFRWSTATDAVEAQKLRCTIKLDYEKATAGEVTYPQCTV